MEAQLLLSLTLWLAIKVKGLVMSGRSETRQIKVEEYVLTMDTSTGRARMDGLAC